MIVKTFTGASLRDALKSVRDSFGADAVILDTRFGGASGNRLGDDARIVSVTAACEPEPHVALESAELLPEAEGPKTLHLKGDLPAPELETEDAPLEDTNPEALILTAPDPEPLPNQPHRLVARSVTQAIAAPEESHVGDGVWPALCRWLATQTDLIAGIADSYATHRAEMVPPLEAFLNLRRKGQRVLFVGERGAGKSTLMFKSFAARWKENQRRPSLRVISELEGHGQEHLESLCRSCEADFSVHEFNKGRLAFDRSQAKGDVMAEFVPGRAYSNLAGPAKIVRRALRPDIVALVLHASGNLQAWNAACDRFAPFGLTHVVFTHWDESQPWWDVTAFVRRRAILLSYHTDGFEPFGEIEPFTTTDLHNGIAEYVTRTIGNAVPSAMQGGSR